jgi:hypothetical protein
LLGFGELGPFGSQGVAGILGHRGMSVPLNGGTGAWGFWGDLRGMFKVDNAFLQLLDSVQEAVPG